MSQVAQKPATIYDVARVAGVSHQSVSRYLRGLEVRPATKAKVSTPCRSWTTEPTSPHGTCAGGRTATIALSIPRRHPRRALLDANPELRVAET